MGGQNAQQLARTVASLYRGILRMHRAKLPGELRDVGDSYVRSEFRSHIKPSTTEGQWAEFITQWRGYLALLQPPAPPTTPDSPAHVDPAAHGDTAEAVDAVRQMSEGLDVYLSPEQRLRMEALRKEAQQLGQSMFSQDSTNQGLHQEPPRQ